MLHTTFGKLKEAGACVESYRKLGKAQGGIEAYGKDTPIPLNRILEVCGFEDALWCLRAVLEPSDRDIRLLACDYAKHVLPIYEKQYPDDKRPRQAIETVRLFVNGKATKEKLARDAWDATWAAWDATWAAGDAVRAAGDAETVWQKKHFIKLLKED